MLGKQDKVIGIPGDVYRGETWQRYSELDVRIREKSLPTPGNWDFVSLEQVVSLEPDLVIIWSSQAQAIENIERFDIPVYAVMMHSLITLATGPQCGPAASWPYHRAREPKS